MALEQLFRHRVLREHDGAAVCGANALDGDERRALLEPQLCGAIGVGERVQHGQVERAGFEPGRLDHLGDAVIEIEVLEDRLVANERAHAVAAHDQAFILKDA